MQNKILDTMETMCSLCSDQTNCSDQYKPSFVLDQQTTYHDALLSSFGIVWQIRKSCTSNEVNSVLYFSLVAVVNPPSML